MAIPLKAKVAIRDHWTKEDSEVQKTLAKCHEELGMKFVCNPDWNLLLNDLDSAYEDKTALVSAVTGCINYLGKAFLDIIKDEDNYGDWIEEMLENGKSTGGINIGVTTAKTDKPSVTWSDNARSYILTIPSKTALKWPAEFFSLFKSNLVDKSVENLPDLRPAETGGASGGGGDDDWADIAVVRSTPQVVSSSTSAGGSGGPPKADVQILVDANSLPRADMLFLQPPYHMTVSAIGGGFEVNCSHSPTLEFLEQYYKKWCRNNIHLHNNPPLAEIKLHPSPWGLGSAYDTLIVRIPDNRYGDVPCISHVSALHLVEAVLGYNQVYTSANTWHYKKDTPLRKI